MFEAVLIIGMLVFAFLSGYLHKENQEMKEKETDLGIRLSDAISQIEIQQEQNKKILSQKKSSEVTTGLILEQAAPFLQEFKYSPRDAVFMGQPIDYVIFTNDEIIFMDIKTGNAKLSTRQKVIRQLVEAKKIRWETIRFNGKHITPETGGADCGEDTGMVFENIGESSSNNDTDTRK